MSCHHGSASVGIFVKRVHNTYVRPRGLTTTTSDAATGVIRCLYQSAIEARFAMSAGALRRVYHLNCGSFRPWRGMTLVTHVLVCEMEHGLILVDVGLGTDDIHSPNFRLGRSPRLAGAGLDISETALRQIERLGFAGSDVTDVVATHLDYDHIGGLADFPDATLHTTSIELDEARKPLHTRGGEVRYRPAHTAAIRKLRTYRTTDTTILGLGASELEGIPDVFLVPTPGHTLGHAAVALFDPGKGWLVHAGDAFMDRSSLSPRSSISLSSRSIRCIELLMATDRKLVRANHAQLAGLAETGVRVFCSHDSAQFEALREEVSLTNRA